MGGYINYFSIMDAKKRLLMGVEPSLAQQALMTQMAERHGLDSVFHAGEASALTHLQEPIPLAVLVVAHRLDEGDSLTVIESIRVSPQFARLPIGFLMSDRNQALAEYAIHAGATEIFLRSEHEALMAFIGECATIDPSPQFGGRVLLVEDSESHAQYVTELCHVLGMEVDHAADVGSAELLLRTHRYQLAIVDVVLRDTRSGISLVREIRRSNGMGLPVLVMSSFDDIPRRLQAIKSGADDFISKPFAAEEFVWRVKAIMNAHAHQDQGHQTLPASTEADAYMALFSPREKQIFHMIIAGDADRYIASELGISFWTVRGHVQQIFNKTGAINRRELMARFISQTR